MTDDVVDVAIVGAGPVGLTLALLLDRLGVRAVVLERTAGPYPMPRAVHLDDDALRVLHAVGATEKLDVRPLDGMSLLDAQGRTILAIDRPRTHPRWPASVLMHQPQLEDLLRTRAGAHVRYDTDVHRLSDEEDGVVLTATGGRRLHARCAVGCDGANSTVRALTGLPVEDLGFRQRWLVLDLLVDGHGQHPPRVLQICDPRGPATSVPVGGGRHRFEVRADDTTDTDEMHARARATANDWLGRFGMQELGVERSAVYEFRGGLATAYRRGRVLLAGDAAHQMPPFLGQGLCTGLRDAAGLAWKLAAVVQGRATPQLLDTYTDERRPHARLAIRLTAAVGGIVADRRPIRAAVRNAAVAGVDRLLPTGLLGRLRVPPLPAGPLVDRRRLPRTLGAPADVVAGAPWTVDRDLPYGGFTILGRGVDPTDGLPPAIVRWWKGIGTTFHGTDAPSHGADLVVVRPDGIVLGRYTPASSRAVSPLADLAVRMTSAGMRADQSR